LDAAGPRARVDRDDPSEGRGRPRERTAERHRRPGTTRTPPSSCTPTGPVTTGEIMELKTYLRVLRQNIALLIAAALLGGLGGLGVGLLTPTTYTAQTQLFVSIPNTGTAVDLQQGSAFTQERMQTYVDMANSRSVLRPVIDDLDLAVTPDALAKRVSASSDPETVLISIEATDRSAQASARIAEAVAASLVEVVAQLENPTGAGESPVVISVAEAAVPPAVPSSLSPWVAVVLGA